jgi:hypothetical protein
MGGDGLFRLAGRSGLGRLNLRVETGRSGLEWFFVDFVRRGDLALAFAAEAGFACAFVTADAAVSTASLEMAPASASMTSNLKTTASAARAPRSLRPRASSGAAAGARASRKQTASWPHGEDATAAGCPPPSPLLLSVRKWILAELDGDHDGFRPLAQL